MVGHVRKCRSCEKPLENNNKFYDSAECLVTKNGARNLQVNRFEFTVLVQRSQHSLRSHLFSPIVRPSPCHVIRARRPRTEKCNITRNTVFVSTHTFRALSLVTILNTAPLAYSMCGYLIQHSISSPCPGLSLYACMNRLRVDVSDGGMEK